MTEKLGRYEIIRELGKGAMGVVYLGKDPLIGRELALKTFRVGLSSQDKELEQFRARFLREAQSAGILNHPNIVTIHDVAVNPDGDFFIAMEYVKGTDLKHLMQRQGRLDQRFVIDTVAQIADGLDYAHAKGVVHRDIKPANIIITSEKQAKITDFGIARVDASNLTTEGQLLGTPNYMAPEQIQAHKVDHRADIFSLGVMLYELLTGKKPFQGDNLTQVTHRIVYEPYPDPKQFVPNLPSNLEQVLSRALAKKPDDRYLRGAEMAQDLRATFNRPTASAIGSSGSFLGDDAGTNTGPIPTTAGITMTSAAAHEALKPTPTAAIQVGTGVFKDPTAGTAPQTQDTGGGKSGLLIAGVAGLLGLALLAFVMMGGGDTETRERSNADDELQASYQPFIDEAQRLIDNGDPDGALIQVEKALAVAPNDRRARELRQTAEEMLLQQSASEEGANDALVEYRLKSTREALGRRDYKEAMRLAQSALDLDPENADGLALLAEAKDGQDRRDQVRDRFRTPPTTQAGQGNATQPPGPVAPPPPEAPVEAQLAIEFNSRIPEGRLTIFNGASRIYQESFKFKKQRVGVLQRSQSANGSLSATVTVPTGTLKLSIYTRPSGGETRITELEGELAPAGGTLTINLTEDGFVEAVLK